MQTKRRLFLKLIKENIICIIEILLISAFTHFILFTHKTLSTLRDILIKHFKKHVINYDVLRCHHHQIYL